MQSILPSNRPVSLFCHSPPVSSCIPTLDKAEIMQNGVLPNKLAVLLSPCVHRAAEGINPVSPSHGSPNTQESHLVVAQYKFPLKS